MTKIVAKPHRTPENKQKVLGLLNIGTSVIGVSKEIGVTKDQVFSWIKVDEDLKKAKDHGQKLRSQRFELSAATDYVRATQPDYRDRPVLYIAKLTGVTTDTVRQWTRSGGLTPYTADKIAVALGLHPKELWPEWDKYILIDSLEMCSC